mmetsp:Transcript_2138/g.1851  ORF Transcript_2138/g.1851 Transcript_2138/m.1851 type:complete len:547 (-) Transcript_2138:20-1660(-)
MALLTILMITLIKFCATKTPNILFMLADDMGWSDISYRGHGSDISTPNIDALFDSGIELTNYYTHPVCSPTRSAILTGLYSFQNGLQYLDTIPPGTTEHIPDQVPTLMELLRNELNYTNEMIGKWHLGYASWNYTPIGRGFDNHYGFFQDAQDYFTHVTISPNPEEKFLQGYDFWDNKQDIHDSYSNGHPVYNTYSTPLFQEQFKKVMTNYVNIPVEDRKPLFMYLPFQTVHTPTTEIGHNMNYSVCNNITNKDRQKYCDKLFRLDIFIGNITQQYKDLGLWDNTLVVLTSDNGGMPNWNSTGLKGSGVARSFGCNMPYRGGKATLYEGGIKSFGVINGGVIKGRNYTFSGLMHSIDWMPTIYEGLLGGSLTNIINDKTRFGLNLWDQIMSNKILNETSQRILYLDIEKNGSVAGVRQGDYKYFTGRQASLENCALYPGSDLCLLYHGYYPCNQSTPYDTKVGNDTEFLYNLANDSFEKYNLANDPTYSDRLSYLKGLINDFVNSPDYMQEQSLHVYGESIDFEKCNTFHNISSNSSSNCTWTPWL